ncbi:hypothetical protein [uncultured Nostoc sp.]|nr:hypothetical protein [uncultured Nostoc sp.]
MSPTGYAYALFARQLVLKGTSFEFRGEAIGWQVGSILRLRRH